MVAPRLRTALRFACAVFRGCALRFAPCARHFSPSGLRCSQAHSRLLPASLGSSAAIAPSIRNGRPAAPYGLQYSLAHWASLRPVSRTARGEAPSHWARASCAPRHCHILNSQWSFRIFAPPSPSAARCSVAAHCASLRVLATPALRASDVRPSHLSVQHGRSASFASSLAALPASLGSSTAIAPSIRNGRPAAPYGLQYSPCSLGLLRPVSRTARWPSCAPLAAPSLSPSLGLLRPVSAHRRAAFVRPSPVSAKILRIFGRGNCKEAIFALENGIFRHGVLRAPAPLNSAWSSAALTGSLAALPASLGLLRAVSFLNSQ